MLFCCICQAIASGTESDSDDEMPELQEVGDGQTNITGEKDTIPLVC